jgi:hypothetical protein
MNRFFSFGAYESDSDERGELTEIDVDANGRATAVVLRVDSPHPAA